MTKGHLCKKNKIFWCSDHGGAYMESHHHLKKWKVKVQGQAWINRKPKASKILSKIKSVMNMSTKDSKNWIGDSTEKVLL